MDAVCEIMKEFGAEELLPYCNIADHLMAKSLGFAFENPRVLGWGDSPCVGLFRTSSGVWGDFPL